MDMIKDDYNPKVKEKYNFMKILITEFMEAKSVEMLKRNFDVTVDKNLSVDHNELKKIRVA